jgi:rhamnosyltransferase
VDDNQVCAVVVTFCPKAGDSDNLRKLRSQVEKLVVVDNGSPAETLAQLRDTSKHLDFTLIENGTNLGIAAALNTGVRLAKVNRYKWVALFDQDSTVTEGFVAHMLHDFESIAKERNIMQIVPRYRDPDTGKERVTELDKDGGPFLTITSGSIFPVEVFDECGYFREDLFVYAVDGDYSLRLRSAGFSIGESKTAVLLHKSGNPTYHRILGRAFATHNYRPASRYYGIRNGIWMVRTYGRRYPKLILPILRSVPVTIVKIVIAERERWPKLKMVVRGFLDGVVGRMGKVVEP